MKTRIVQKSQRHFIMGGALSSVVVACMIACGPPGGGELGESGELRFVLGESVGSRSFIPDVVATGVSLTISVADASLREGEEVAATIQSASSSDDSIATVDEIATKWFRVSTKSSGTFSVDVTANDGGDTFKDSMKIQVADVAKVIPSHSCTDDSRAFYLINNRVEVSRELRSEQGDPIYGPGIHPVEIVNGSAQAVLSTAQSSDFSIALDTGAVVGESELKSMLGSEDIELNMVDPSGIDGVGLQSESIRLKGGVQTIGLSATADQRDLCQPTFTFTVAVQTPTLCSVKKLDGMNVEVTPLKEGMCDLKFTVPDGMAGAGLTSVFSLEVR